MPDTIKVGRGVELVKVQAPPGQAFAFYVKERVPDDESCCGNIPQEEIDRAFERPMLRRRSE